MLWAYLDESGVHDSKNVLRRYALGGGVAQYDVWQEIRALWQAQLQNAGIEWFHYKEWKRAYMGHAKKSQPFYSWPEQKLIEFLNGLASIISKKNVDYISASVRKVKSKREVRDSYLAVATEVINKIEQILRQISKPDEISFMFSMHQELAGIRICDYFEKLKKLHPSFKDCAIGNPRNEPALQIADLIANEAARSRNISASFGPIFHMPELTKTMQLLLQPPPFHHMIENHKDDDFYDLSW